MSEEVGIVRIGDLIIDFINRKITYRGKELQTGGVTRPISPPLTSEEIADGAVTTSKIADNAVTRGKLEYPTEDVQFNWLTLIGKVQLIGHGHERYYKVATVDSFTDKGLEGVTGREASCLLPRIQDYRNNYCALVNVPASTADFGLLKFVNGTHTWLATEAVDLVENCLTHIRTCMVGSTLKGQRFGYGANFNTVVTTVSATDTTFAAGYFGVAPHYRSDNPSGLDRLYLKLIAPFTSLPSAQAVVEVEVEGEGTEREPFRPAFKRSLVSIDEANYSIDKTHVTKLKAIKKLGLSIDEAKALFGSVKTHIDVDAVTWGAFDYKFESTMICIITGDNPYESGAIERQKEHALKKGLKVLQPPKSYVEAVEQYKKLKSDFKEWLAGKDNYAYQVLGDERLELLAVADFYYGELIEHKTHYEQLKKVPSWELERTINVWASRLEKVDVLHDERDKHVKKLREVLKKGW